MSELVRAEQNTVVAARYMLHQPQVSFDVNLGKQLSYIDFHAEAYTEHLRERDLARVDIAGLKINFAAQRFSLIRAGGYDPYEREIVMNVTPRSTDKKVNNTLAHETEHHIAAVTGTVTAASMACTGITNVARFSGMAAAVLSLPTKLAGDLARSDIITETGTGIAYACLGLLALSQIAYFSNPEERRALKVGRANTATIVHIER